MAGWETVLWNLQKGQTWIKQGADLLAVFILLLWSHGEETSARRMKREEQIQSQKRDWKWAMSVFMEKKSLVWPASFLVAIHGGLHSTHN